MAIFIMLNSTNETTMSLPYFPSFVSINIFLEILSAISKNNFHSLYYFGVLLTQPGQSTKSVHVERKEKPPKPQYLIPDLACAGQQC